MDGNSTSRPRHLRVENAFRILLVSQDNVSRSPMAECLLRKSLTDRGSRSAIQFELSSAATHGLAGAEMDPWTADELRRLDASPDGFHSQALTREKCEDADLILTSTLTQRSHVLTRYPEALRRTFTLLEFAQNAPRVYDRQSESCPPKALVKLTAAARGSAPVNPYDVADSAGDSPKQHRRNADLTLAAVQAISAVLLPGVPADLLIRDALSHRQSDPHRPGPQQTHPSSLQGHFT